MSVWNAPPNCRSEIDEESEAIWAAVRPAGIWSLFMCEPMVPSVLATSASNRHLRRLSETKTSGW